MAEHLVPLGVLVVVAGLLCVAARRTPGRWTGIVAAMIAAGIVITELSWQPYVLANHTWSVALSLPMQLCDVGGFVAAAALVWRQAVLVEVAYFWGLGGTVQALLTPDLRDHFPAFPYLQFYATHDLVVLAALFLVIRLRLQPRAGAVRPVFLITLAFAAVNGLVDLGTGGHFLFLRQGPGPASPRRVMGSSALCIPVGAL